MTTFLFHNHISTSSITVHIVIRECQIQRRNTIHYMMHYFTAYYAMAWANGLLKLSSIHLLLFVQIFILYFVCCEVLCMVLRKQRFTTIIHEYTTYNALKKSTPI